MSPSSDQYRSAAALPGDDPAGCYWLAGLAGAGSVLLGALMLRGAFVSGVPTDVAPCLLTVLLTSLAVAVAGRLESRGAVVVTTCSTVAAIAAGKMLAWDLLGVVGRLSGETAAGGTWLDRVASGWETASLAQQWINAAAWLLTPILASLGVIAWGKFLAGRDPPVTTETSAQAAALVNTPKSPALARPGPPQRPTFLILVTTVWVLLVAGLQWGFQRPGRNAFLDVTQPVVRANQENTILGFAHLRDGQPQMCEEIPAIEQATWLQGAVRSDSNFRFLRTGYAILATPFTPLCGPEGGLRVLNVLAWLVSLVCIGCIAARLGGGAQAGCIAVVLAAPGVGYAVHWNATTPHLTSFALYAAGVLLLISQEIPTRPRGGELTF